MVHLSKWQLTPVLLPGKSHGWKSVVGYSPWGCRESDMTERLYFTSLDMRRCKDWAHKISSWKYLTSEDLFCQFSQRTEGLIPDLHPEFFAGILKVSDYSDSWSNLCRGRWQGTIFSWHHHTLRLEFSVYEKIVKINQKQVTCWEEVFAVHFPAKGFIQNIWKTPKNKREKKQKIQI